MLALLVFTLAFAAWTLFAVIGVDLKYMLGLSETAFGVLLAMPMLIGAVACLPLGVLAERWGGRRVMLGCLLLLCPFLIWISVAQHYIEFLIAGAGLGLAAGLFGAGLPYVAAWSPPNREGFALGLYGSGMIGAGLTYLLVPMVNQAYGWRLAPWIYLILLLLAALLLWWFGEDEEHHQRPRRQPAPTLKMQLAVLAGFQVWRFGIYYSFVFGAFVALALWLPDYLAAHYQVPLQRAAILSLIFTLPGALMQIPGGLLADFRGARQVNWLVFWTSLVCLFFLSYPPTSMVVHGIDQDLHLELNMPLPIFLVLLFIMGTAMGFGKGSVMRLVFNYYPDRMGVVGGLVVAMGGLAAFVLPVLFGIANDVIGVRSAAFMLLYGLLAACMILMFFGARHEERRRRLQLARQDEFVRMIRQEPPAAS